MNFWSIFSKKAKNAFTEFATKSLGEAVKTGVSALATVVLHSTSVGAIMGAGAKGMIDVLLSRTFQIDKKIDRLLREPLFSGITLLHQGLSHTTESKEECKAQRDLLHAAHVAFVRALGVAIDSREDSVFIRTLDCMALAAHKGNKSLAKDSLVRLEMDLQELGEGVNILEKEAFVATENSEAMQRFLNDNPRGDRPVGYAEQKLIGKQIIKNAAKIKAKADEARNRIDILNNLKYLAEQLINVNN